MGIWQKLIKLQQIPTYDWYTTDVSDDSTQKVEIISVFQLAKKI